MRYWFLSIALGLMLHPSSAQSQSSPPNILFIMADDLGFGDLGSYGQQTIQTPHLDRLAREGLRLTNAYAGSPVCAPSRSVLMTGQHTGHTTVRGNVGQGGVRGLGGRDGRIPLTVQDITIATLLRDHGYRTGMVGKWGLGEPETSGMPDLQGFDYFYGYLNQRRAHHYYPAYLWENDRRDSLHQNSESPDKYSHDLFTEKAIDFIKQHRQVPFFLYLPYTIPHDRYEIPDLFPYEDSTRWGRDAQVHAAMVTRMDRDIGKIMHLLDQLDLRNNTLIFFCSDNGAAQRWEGIFDSSGALRGRKRDLYEGGIRTPMIVSLPGVIPSRSVSNQPLHFMDILPTIAAFVDLPVSADIDGMDLSNHLRFPDLLPRERTLYWEFYERGFQQAIRWKDWKAVRPGINQAWELYDLQSDISESDNVADAHPEIIAMVEEMVQHAHQPSPYFKK